MQEHTRMRPSSLIPGKPVYNSTDASRTIKRPGEAIKRPGADFFATSLMALPHRIAYGRMPAASSLLLIPQGSARTVRTGTHQRQPTEGERLHRRNVGVWIAALMLACVLVPSSGSSAGNRSSRLQRIQDERQRLTRELAEKSQHADSLRSRINVLNHAINDLQIQINRLNTMITRVRSQVRTAQAHIDATQELIAKVQGRARRQAIMLYKDGGTQTLDTLLSSKSLVELDNRVELLGIAATQNTAALIRFGRLRVRLKVENRTLFERQKELQDQRAEQERSLDTRAELRARVASALEKVNGQIRHVKDKEKSLADQEKHIRIVIAQAQAKSAVTVTGISSQGFIWPLNTAITSPFGPRWGSFHPGIDLAGYTGEPFVAAKGGRVIYASWMDGYGNATMIDVGGGIVTLYGHQTRLGVSAGENVRQGQVIGYVGCTGYCTGPHLHFEVRVNGAAEDPMRYLP